MPAHHHMVTRSRSKYGKDFDEWRLVFNDLSRLFYAMVWKIMYFTALDTCCFSEIAPPCYKSSCVRHACVLWWYDYYVIFCQLSTAYPIVSGGFSCHLVFDTTRYDDVDIFLPFEDHIKIMKAVRKKILETDRSELYVIYYKSTWEDNREYPRRETFISYKLYAFSTRTDFYRCPPLNLIFYRRKVSLFKSHMGDHSHTQFVLDIMRGFDLDMPKVALRNIQFVEHEIWHSAMRAEVLVAATGHHPSSTLASLNMVDEDAVLAYSTRRRARKYCKRFEKHKSHLEPGSLSMMSWEKCREMYVKVDQDLELPSVPTVDDEEPHGGFFSYHLRL